MDGVDFVPTFRDQGWSTRLGKKLSGAETSLFLMRDLSEEALRPVIESSEPAISAEDLACARRDGYSAGHAAGLAEATASLAADEVRALGLIGTRMADARDAATHVADAAASALAGALVAALNAVMPDLLRRSALSETNAMLAIVLEGLAQEPHVQIEVPAAIAQGVSAAIMRSAIESPNGVEVIGVDDLAAGAARVRWAAGTARRQPDDLWKSVMDALESTLSQA